MARIVLKTAKGRDQYVIWGTVVDDVIAGPGDRGQAADYLRSQMRHTDDQVEEVLARVDEHGSSDRTVRFGWWDDDPLPVVSGSPNDGWYHLPRGRLADYADALGRDDEWAARALLVCWQRHDEGD